MFINHIKVFTVTWFIIVKKQKQHNNLLGAEVWRPKYVSLFPPGQRVWTLLRISDKCSYTSWLGMWLLGSFDINMVHTSRFIPSWQMVRMCKHTSLPSFVVWGYLGNSCLHGGWLHCQDNRMLMTWCLKVLKRYPLNNVKEVFCCLPPLLY